MDRHESDYLVLRDFLSLPHRAEAVLDRFAGLPHAVKEKHREKEGFVYIPGTRENAVLLVAHADTVGEEDLAVELAEDDRIIRNRRGIPGADDRQDTRLSNGRMDPFSAGKVRHDDRTAAQQNGLFRQHRYRHPESGIINTDRSRFLLFDSFDKGAEHQVIHAAVSGLFSGTFEFFPERVTVFAVEFVQRRPGLRAFAGIQGNPFAVFLNALFHFCKTKCTCITL